MIVCKSRGFVTGGRSEIIVISAVDDDIGDSNDDVYVLAGQHAIIAFCTVAESCPENPHIQCSLNEGS